MSQYQKQILDFIGVVMLTIQKDVDTNRAIVHSVNMSVWITIVYVLIAS